jgi:hypothetical protein
MGIQSATETPDGVVSARIIFEFNPDSDGHTASLSIGIYAGATLDRGSPPGPQSGRYVPFFNGRYTAMTEQAHYKLLRDYMESSPVMRQAVVTAQRDLAQDATLKNGFFSKRST